MSAERRTKFFHSIGREKRGPNSYSSLHLESTEPGKISDDIEEMLSECVVHFKNRYRLVPSCDVFDQNPLLENITPLTAEQKEASEPNLSEAELRASLFSMQNGSSPGPDGFTAAFFIVFWDELKNLITLVIK